MFGLRDKGQLFAFIGLHDDHAMGMLEVMPDYRRQGWGERLERALIAKLLKMGELRLWARGARQRHLDAASKETGVCLVQRPYFLDVVRVFILNK